ncbi:erythromycin esterase family protein [Nonomuraea rubra]|uniref:Erythromycin esterase n=1 Tax=Nonomuraea rubra TaxID=46180 RepID=A0A7X0U1G3_9ACTN|nr:erythromycin esterase family protein [Nonomuraea rubra]MBB6551732.1 erythromycin esterase [Nonomuraea rubra]
MLHLLMAGVLATTPVTDPQVIDWIERNARQEITKESIGGATVVGLGESTHGTHEEAVIKFGLLRYLVEELGFRSIAWEEDWTTSVRVNRYVLTGDGDLGALMGELTTTWRTREVRDVLAWLRSYNADHPGRKVKFVGVEYYATRSLAHDAVSSYVAKAAPWRLRELRRHLAFIAPRHENTRANLEWYLDVPDKRPFISHARAVYRLVERLPENDDQQLALHHARQILSWYEAFDLPFEDIHAYRDARAAENLRWWQRRTGDKVAYWAAAAHTAAAPGLRLTLGGPPLVFDNAGSYLRRWYGDRYRSITVLFDHGTLGPGSSCDAAPVPVPRPDAGFANRVFGDAFAGGGPAQYVVDLRGEAPEAVSAWLRAPAKVRGYGGYDPALAQKSYMEGGSLAQWFDVVVHRQVVTPCKPL